MNNRWSFAQRSGHIIDIDDDDLATSCGLRCGEHGVPGAFVLPLPAYAFSGDVNQLQHVDDQPGVNVIVDREPAAPVSDGRAGGWVHMVSNSIDSGGKGIPQIDLSDSESTPKSNDELECEDAESFGHNSMIDTTFTMAWSVAALEESDGSLGASQSLDVSMVNHDGGGDGDAAAGPVCGVSDESESDGSEGPSMPSIDSEPTILPGEEDNDYMDAVVEEVSAMTHEEPAPCFTKDKSSDRNHECSSCKVSGRCPNCNRRLRNLK